MCCAGREGVERVWFAPGCSIFGPVAKERVLRCAFQMKGSNESFVWKCCLAPQVLPWYRPRLPRQRSRAMSFRDTTWFSD